jgi:hypothetical protein
VFGEDDRINAVKPPAIQMKMDEMVPSLRHAIVYVFDGYFMVI